MHPRRLAPGVLAATTALALVGLPGVAVAAPAATAADIVINEVESNGDPVGDWVELANTDTVHDLDISGWSLVDDDPKHAPLTIPAGTVIESGGYYSVYTDVKGGFGLGAADSVTLFDATGARVDSTSWTAHAATTWGRVPDRTGPFSVTPAPTRGAPNGGGDTTPPVTTAPFPGDPLTQTPVALGGAFAGEDMSGVDVDADGTTYVVNNGTGTLYVLARDAAGVYTVSKTFVLKYPDGTGIPDAEGVTVGPDGSVVVATERDNAVKSVNRPSLLRYRLPATATSGELRAETEYDLRAITGPLGANAGPEAVEFVPDVRGGVYAVGVEGTAKVHVVQLGDGGTVTPVQTVDTPLEGVMALDYDPVTRRLHVLCDEACEGRSIDLTHDGSTFSTDGTVYARPAGTANHANEGFASHHERVECTVDGRPGTADRVRYLWADDAAADGVALRTATGPQGTCTPDPTAPGSSVDAGSLGRVEFTLPGSLAAGSLGSGEPASGEPTLPVGLGSLSAFLGRG